MRNKAPRLPLPASSLRASTAKNWKLDAGNWKLEATGALVKYSPERKGK
jgi:hypothetical protein